MGGSGAATLTQEYGCVVKLNYFAGQVVCVDVSNWMYLGMAVKPWFDPTTGGKNWTGVVQFIFARLETLVHAGIRPLVVLDGAALPGKAAEVTERQAKRAAAHTELLRRLEAKESINNPACRKLVQQMAGRDPGLTTALLVALSKHGCVRMMACAPVLRTHACLAKITRARRRPVGTCACMHGAPAIVRWHLLVPCCCTHTRARAPALGARALACHASRCGTPRPADSIP
jgi:hypothetical protein